MRSTVLSSVLGIIATMVSMANSDSTDPNCQFGRLIAEQLNEKTVDEMLMIKCNHTCSEVLCSASLSIEVMKIHQTLCFGLNLNHCAQPANLDYFIFLPKSNVSRHGKLTHSDTAAIPGPSFAMGQTSLIISTQLEHVSASVLKYGWTFNPYRAGNEFIYLCKQCRPRSEGFMRSPLIRALYVCPQINASVKLTQGQFEMFPYSFTLLPTQTINVPSCESKATDAPPSWPERCNADSVPVIPATKAKPNITSKSQTYGKDCELGLLQCTGQNEMCILKPGNPSRNGTCKCDTVSVLSPATGLCETSIAKSTVKPSVETSAKAATKSPGTAKPTVVTSPAPAGNQTSNTKGNPSASTKGKASSNITVIIAGSVIGGILLAAVVVGVIICIGRRRRNARYRDRVQLLTDDDDDLDTNVVI